METGSEEKKIFILLCQFWVCVAGVKGRVGRCKPYSDEI